MREEDFRTRLDAELEDEAGPPIGALVAAATLSGERQRRHRRVLQLTTGAFGVAAVMAGATLAAGYVGQDARPAASTSPVGAPASPPATTAAPATPPTSATTTAGPVTITSGSLPTERSDTSEHRTLPPVPPGQDRTTAQSMLLVLEQEVTKVGGAGDFTHLTGYAPDGDPRQTQTSTFMGDLYWNHSTIAVRYTLPPADPDPKAAKNPDGDVFRWDTPGVAGTSEVKLAKSERGVELTRADGSKVVVLEINGPELGGAGPDRADLPLTSDQLLAIARDPRWGPTMDKAFVAEAAATIQLEPRP
ncbi:hypothetical protein [Catenulispora subtropica]|uniref:Uncharacterized protein n=1 Tax=Catenulispora subtropica TaxID=450798 RepID=A0ABP5DYR9_9ACTN